ncbi:MAG: hypothetical protein WCG03_05420 [Kiritimatiellales bacterium]
MKHTISKEEVTRVRTLAKRQAGLAALPVMEVRKKRWTDMNDENIDAIYRIARS